MPMGMPPPGAPRPQFGGPPGAGAAAAPGFGPPGSMLQQHGAPPQMGGPRPPPMGGAGGAPQPAGLAPVATGGGGPPGQLLQQGSSSFSTPRKAAGGLEQQAHGTPPPFALQVASPSPTKRGVMPPHMQGERAGAASCLRV